MTKHLLDQLNNAMRIAPAPPLPIGRQAKRPYKYIDTKISAPKQAIFVSLSIDFIDIRLLS